METQAAHDPSFTVCTLASGSRGNAIYVSDGRTTLLIDAGLSGIEIERRLGARGLSADRIDAILVSHEHADHIQGVGVLSRRFKIPVYLNRSTHRALPAQIGKFSLVRHFDTGRRFTVGSLVIHPFSISHDADDPAGFTFQNNGLKIGLATDLGVATALVREHLKGCRLLILEANHDVGMLETGPYPWPLKQRIRSRLGHLCNEASRDLLAELLHDDLAHVVLAHLSQTNNTPEKAVAAVAPVLNRSRATLTVALQDEPGPSLSVS
jgi:phosphoribosyl 1,2-cyclic phosphodiesterase